MARQSAASAVGHLPAAARVKQRLGRSIMARPSAAVATAAAPPDGPPVGSLGRGALAGGCPRETAAWPLHHGRAFGGRRHEHRPPPLPIMPQHPSASEEWTATETPWRGRDNRPCSVRWATHGAANPSAVFRPSSRRQPIRRDPGARRKATGRNTGPKLPHGFFGTSFSTRFGESPPPARGHFRASLMGDRPCPQCREAWGQGMCPKNRRAFPEFGRID